MKRTTNRALVAPVKVAVFAVTLTVFGCSEAPPPPQPPEVTVAKPEPRDVTQWGQFPGTTEAFESAEIRARVSGNLERMTYRAASLVERGDLLFQIEKTEHLAAFEEAKADLEASKADLVRKQSDLERIELAIESNAVSQQDLDRAKADVLVAEAAVLGAESRLARAELNYSYTDVRSPIQGFASRRLVDPGNLVGAGENTLLTTVRNLDPMFVYFDLPEVAIIRLLELIQDDGKKLGTLDDIPDIEERIESDESVEVFVALSTDEGFPHRGYIDFIDNTVNPSTGTIQARARLPNPDFLLFPGLFVRVRVAGGTIEDAITIDEQAVMSDIGGKYVFVVGDENVVEARYVTLGPLSEDGRVSVLEGLDGSEDYIVNGILRARPGLPVTPTQGPTGAASTN